MFWENGGAMIDERKIMKIGYLGVYRCVSCIHSIRYKYILHTLYLHDLIFETLF